MVGLCLLFGLPLIQLNDVSYRLGQRLIQRQPMWLFDGASENALWDGLELANAVACVKDLPQDIDTIVGDRRTLSPQALVNEFPWQGYCCANRSF